MSTEVAQSFVAAESDEPSFDTLQVVLPDAVSSAAERPASARFRLVAAAVASLVSYPFQWELRREYVPVRGNPRGADECRSKSVLRRKRQL